MLPYRFRRICRFVFHAGFMMMLCAHFCKISSPFLYFFLSNGFALSFSNDLVRSLKRLTIAVRDVQQLVASFQSSLIDLQALFSTTFENTVPTGIINCLVWTNCFGSSPEHVAPSSQPSFHTNQRPGLFGGKTGSGR